MHVRHLAGLATLALGIAATTLAGSIDLKLSGPGVVNDSTVTVGEPVSVDIYVENDSLYTGFTFGFVLTSDEIDSIIHVADSGNGLNPAGDIKGHNGWQDHTIWNFGGVYAVTTDWNGAMPELIGFGGLSVQQQYEPHDRQKVLSFDIIVPEPGSMTIDSSFFPPGGKWMFATPVPGIIENPEFGGALHFKAVAK
jgi:hypothetical protein